MDGALPPQRSEQAERIRARLREQCAMGELDDRRVEIEVEESAVGAHAGVLEAGMEEIGFNLGDMLGDMLAEAQAQAAT